ncbi:unnamed protein product, partial [Ixodes hexagonus]
EWPRRLCCTYQGVKTGVESGKSWTLTSVGPKRTNVKESDRILEKESRRKVEYVCFA